MAAPRLPAVAGEATARMGLRFAAVALTLFCFPAPSRALDARLRWGPSPDARVQGYYVYLRQANRTYGMPSDVGAPPRAGDGALFHVLTDLDPTATYYVAVSAYTDDRLESSLSNELPIGTTDPCVQDACTAPTQCSVQTSPDGTPCGPAGGACGATCIAGTCAGLGDHALAIERVRVKVSEEWMRIAAKARFPASALFDPAAAGVELVVGDPAGTTLARVVLSSGDLRANGSDASVVRALVRRDPTAALELRRLTFRTNADETRVKARLVARPGPGSQPGGATVTLQSGALCVAGEALDCTVKRHALSCR